MPGAGGAVVEVVEVVVDDVDVVVVVVVGRVVVVVFGGLVVVVFGGLTDVVVFGGPETVESHAAATRASPAAPNTFLRVLGPASEALVEPRSVFVESVCKSSPVTTVSSAR